MSEKKTRAADKRKRQEDPKDSIKDEFKLKKTKTTVESKTKAAVAKTGDKKLGKKTIDSLASMEYPCGKCYNMRCKNDLRWHRTQSKGYKWYCEPCMNETYGAEVETEDEEEETKPVVKKVAIGETKSKSTTGKTVLEKKSKEQGVELNKSEYLISRVEGYCDICTVRRTQLAPYIWQRGQWRCDGCVLVNAVLSVSKEPKDEETVESKARRDLEKAEADDDLVDYEKTPMLVAEVEDEESDDESDCDETALVPNTDNVLFEQARERGRECPFRKYDQITFIADKNNCVDPEFKHASRFVVDHVKPSSNAPVCEWTVYVKVHKGSDKIEGFPLHMFTLLAAHNDPDNYVA